MIEVPASSEPDRTRSDLLKSVPTLATRFIVPPDFPGKGAQTVDKKYGLKGVATLHTKAQDARGSTTKPSGEPADPGEGADRS
jgi:hypothetical protein